MSRAFLLSFGALAFGCSEAVDKAAKQRIFSPEDPPKAVSAASQKLPPEDVAEKSEVARRVLGMGAAEATERLGPHTYNATVTFEWSTVEKTVRLKETRLLEAGAGGMSGDFHGKLDNSREQGLEVLRVGGQVFARSQGKYRERRRDRGLAERLREELFGAIGDFDEFFHGRLALSAQGTQSYEGRTAWKYVVSLGPAHEVSPKELPPRAVPKNGVDETTVRRLHFYEARSPRALQGEVLVDSETSVVLKARLDGRLGTASDAGDAELRLVLDSSISAIGRDPKLRAPKEFLPDEDKPQGIAAALVRFGIPRGGLDAGTPKREGTDVDDEEAP